MPNAATGVGIEGGTLSRDDFMLHWDNIAKELDRNPVIWADYYTKEAIYDAVLGGMIQAWAFSEDGKIRVILFTRLIDYPKIRALQVMLAFGNSIDKLLPRIEATLENFGRKTECEVCEIIGRDGWIRKLKHRFKKRAVLLIAPISTAPLN